MNIEDFFDCYYINKRNVHSYGECLLRVHQPRLKRVHLQSVAETPMWWGILGDNLRYFNNNDHRWISRIPTITLVDLSTFKMFNFWSSDWQLVKIIFMIIFCDRYYL